MENNLLLNQFELTVSHTKFNQFDKDIKRLKNKLEKLGGILEVELIDVRICEKTYSIKSSLELKIPNYKLIAINRLNLDKYIYMQLDNSITVPDDIKELYTCQHCNTNRKRKMYYIMYNDIDNKFMVLGSNCSKQYFGLDIEKYLKQYQYTIQFLEAYGENEINKDAVDVLYTVEKIVANDLFYSLENKNYSTYKYDLYDNVLNFGFSSDTEELRQYYKTNTAVINKKAVETIEYILNMDNTENNEYIRNLKDILSNELMDKKFIKYILYCTKLVQIDKSKKKIKPAVKPSGYIGQIKDRLDLTLTVTNIIELDNYYSNDTTYMYLFTDKENNVFKWVTSAIKLDKDKTYKIKGTVKQHTEYKGIKQTVLTRCKIEK